MTRNEAITGNFCIFLHLQRCLRYARPPQQRRAGEEGGGLGSLRVTICLGISEVLVCLTTCKRLNNSVPKLSLRPFLIQSDLSVKNGLFLLKPKSGFLIQSKKGFFDSTFFDLEFRLADPVEKLDVFDWILQSKNSVEKVLHVFFEPIASLIPPPNTHPHGHTVTHPYQVLHCSMIQGADAGLAIPAAASRRKSAWRIPSSARQQRVSRDGSSARSRSHAANNGCACCSFGGSRLSATPRT